MMITTLQVQIQSGTFRDHAIEQGATVQELATVLKEHVTQALAEINYRAVAAAVLADSGMTLDVPVRDGYADLPEDDETHEGGVPVDFDGLRDARVGD